MIFSSADKMKVLLDLDNRYDYQLFLERCEARGLQVVGGSELEFAQKVGMIMCALFRYPDMSPVDAYVKFVQTAAEPPKPNRYQEEQQSKGLGDTVAKVTKATGLDKLAELYTKVSGKPCGCASRQEALNKLFPYNIKEENSNESGIE